MNPKSFGRSKSKDPRQVAISLVESALKELEPSRGDMAATRSAFIHFFQQGAKANIAMRELMDLVPIIFVKAGYSQPEALAAMKVVKAITPEDIKSGN